jgi:hypothetical protein
MLRRETLHSVSFGVDSSGAFFFSSVFLSLFAFPFSSAVAFFGYNQYLKKNKESL